MTTEQQYLKAGTGSTPTVDYQINSGNCSIIGVSTPVDSMDFYRPIIQWVVDHQNEIKEGTQFEFQLNYFNSSSMKALLWLIQQISELIQGGKNWKLVWVILDEDEFMQEGGEAIQSLIDAQMEIVSR